MPEASAISQDREERKRHGRFSLLKVRGRSEARDTVHTALRSRAGRLMSTQDGRRLFGGEEEKDSERQSGCRPPARQSGRDRAPESQSRSNARRTLNRKCAPAICVTSL